MPSSSPRVSRRTPPRRRAPASAAQLRACREPMIEWAISVIGSGSDEAALAARALLAGNDVAHRHLGGGADESELNGNARLPGASPTWERIGGEQATVFSH